MNRINALLFLFVTLIGFTAEAQNKSISLEFQPTYGGEPITISDEPSDVIDSIAEKITTAKFYISNLQLLKEKVVVFRESTPAFLLDASRASTLTIQLQNLKEMDFDAVQFDLGIDSVTNVSGAYGGDLDPTNGMYWTWQSGYINCKLEGRSARCHSKNNEFQFHVGGYQFPFSCLQTVSLAVKAVPSILVEWDMEAILKHINLSTSDHIMSPGEEAVRVAKIMAKAFQVVEQ
jgi:hypothetical protein